MCVGFFFVVVFLKIYFALCWFIFNAQTWQALMTGCSQGVGAVNKSMWRTAPSSENMGELQQTCWRKMMHRTVAEE